MIAQEQQIYYMTSKAAGAAEVQHMGLFPVKITTFKVEISPENRGERRYSEDERLNMRRNLVHSSNLGSRRPTPAEIAPEREAKTVQRSRFSHFVQKEISKMQEDNSQLQGFTPMIREKIKELRGLMQEKVEYMTNHKQNYSFSEYKIKSGHEGNRLSLHSRKQTDSPFAKSFKTKKLFNNLKKAEIKQEVSPPLLPPRKMVLFGGSIDLRKNLSGNPQEKEDLRDRLLQRQWRKQGSRLSHRYYLNRGQRKPPSNLADDVGDDDCKPWQIYKHEQLQHFGHLNYL